MATTFADLSPADQAAFRARLQVYGLDETAITTPDLVVPGGATVRLAPGDPTSAVPARMLTTNSLDDVKRWVGIPDQLYASGKLNPKQIRLPPALLEHPPVTLETTARTATTAAHAHPEATAAAPVRGPVVASDRLTDVSVAAHAYLFGDSSAVAAYKSEIQGTFREFQIPIWLFYTITVAKGGTLEVTGDQKVLAAWKLVIYEGGTVASSGGLRVDVTTLQKIEPINIGTVGNLHVTTMKGAQG